LIANEHKNTRKKQKDGHWFLPAAKGIITYLVKGLALAGHADHQTQER